MLLQGVTDYYLLHYLFAELLKVVFISSVFFLKFFPIVLSSSLGRS